MKKQEKTAFQERKKLNKGGYPGLGGKRKLGLRKPVGETAHADERGGGKRKEGGGRLQIGNY